MNTLEQVNGSFSRDLATCLMNRDSGDGIMKRVKKAMQFFLTNKISSIHSDIRGIENQNGFVKFHKS